MSPCVHCGLPVPKQRRDGGTRGGRFCCFGCRFAHGLARPVATGERGAGPPTTLVLRLGLGIFLAINIMVTSWVFYSTEVFGPAVAPGESFRPLAALFAYLSMFLCTVLVVTLGFPLAADALDRLRTPRGSRFRILERIDTGLLICIGVGAAYLLSVVHTLRGSGSLYFDTAAMVLVIVTLGQYLEATAKRRAAGTAEARLADLPRRAWVRRDGRLLQIDSAELRAGDEVRVRAGEALAADGRVIDGSSRIDESSLTGEHRLRAVRAGDPVLGGSVSVDGALWFVAERVGSDTAALGVRRMLDEARLRQPAIQRVADRIATWFVPGVVLLALLLFARQAWIGEATRGLFVALTVLLISCPCALGIAAPLACWNALRRAARSGIVIDSAATLERAAAVRRALLDKTGTLTGRRLQLRRLLVAPGVTERQALSWSAGLELNSLHPIADALVAEARRHGIEPAEVRDARTLPGLGVEGRVEGRHLRLGSDRLIDDPAGGRTEGAFDLPDDATAVYLAEGQRPLAGFEMVETIREDAAAAVAALRRLGVEASMITGDREGPAARVGLELGLAVESGLLPGDKLARLAAARSGGTRVAAVGDGINDAPLLAAADVGIALRSAADLARQAGNVHLIADRVDRLPLLLAISRHAMRRVRCNLAWAFGYNAIGITLAALGWLTPVFAASAMFVSGLAVVAISRGAGRVRREDFGLPPLEQESDREALPTESEAAVIAHLGRTG